MSSSLRNAVKRVAHKERAQPEARKRLGLLEKHKDYVVRARDFHKKQAYLRTLKKLAEERNPDEFYYKMHRSKVVDGVHKEVREKSLDTSVVAQLKTQDLGYIIHKKAANDQKVEKMRKNLHMIGYRASKSHKIFVENESNVETFDLSAHFDTTPALAKRAHNRVKMSVLEKHVEMTGSSLSAATVKKVLDKSSKSYKELDQRVKRSEKLGSALQKLQLQRNLMGKGAKRKISQSSDDGTDQVEYKWKRERLR